MGPDSIQQVEDAVELLDPTSLRLLVTRRRRQLPASLAEPSADAPSAPSTDSLAGLVANVDRHRQLLSFDIRSRTPVVGPLFFALKWLQRRLMRTYVVQQEAFNDYVLDFLRTLAVEQQRDRAMSTCWDPTCAGPTAQRIDTDTTAAPSRMLVSLRAVGHSRDEPDYPPRLQPGRGCDGLAYLFAGCRLVVGAGYGVERYLAHVRDHGIESLVLARCRRCQQRAQQERLRVAEGDLWEYFSVPQRFAADGFLLTGIIERLSYLDTARLLRLIHRSLSPGKPVALITMSTSAHLDSILEPQEPAEDRRLYSPEFICELAQLCGFEVVGVSFL